MHNSSDQEWFEDLIKKNSDETSMTEKQTRIIHAAVEIFADKGYAATSTSEIAQKAGVAEGTIFRHYKTKKDLLLSISASLIRKVVAPLALRDFNKVLDKPYERFEDFLQAVIRDRKDFASRHLPLLKVLLQEVPFHPELREQFKKMINLTLQRVFKVMEQFKENGQMIDIPSSSAVRMMGTSVLGYVVIRYVVMPESDWDDDVEIDRLVQFILHGLSSPRIG